LAVKNRFGARKTTSHFRRRAILAAGLAEKAESGERFRPMILAPNAFPLLSSPILHTPSATPRLRSTNNRMKYQEKRDNRRTVAWAKLTSRFACEEPLELMADRGEKGQYNHGNGF
jgi:hypothetical protein